MRSNKIDARVWLAPIVLVEIARSRQAICEVRKLPLVALPESAHGIAILPVPLRPQHREIPHLVSALAHIPRFSDQLHIRQRGILMDGVEEATQFVDIMQFPR